MRVRRRIRTVVQGTFTSQRAEEIEAAVAELSRLGFFCQVRIEIEATTAEQPFHFPTVQSLGLKAAGILQRVGQSLATDNAAAIAHRAPNWRATNNPIHTGGEQTRWAYRAIYALHQAGEPITSSAIMEMLAQREHPVSIGTVSRVIVGLRDNLVLMSIKSTGQSSRVHHYQLVPGEEAKQIIRALGRIKDDGG